MGEKTDEAVNPRPLRLLSVGVNSVETVPPASFGVPVGLNNRTELVDELESVKTTLWSVPQEGLNLGNPKLAVQSVAWRLIAGEALNVRDCPTVTLKDKLEAAVNSAI